MLDNLSGMRTLSDPQQSCQHIRAYCAEVVTIRRGLQRGMLNLAPRKCKRLGASSGRSLATALLVKYLRVHCLRSQSIRGIRLKLQAHRSIESSFD
ncbi:uncharacterized protein LAJ45_11626 [Morchella importuna]|uniref:uncharacterized protein n=1 Tax=Morchella importuna TaxID=1174673 RepID=UPI001E8D1FB0|nr:uncharacterized protein LAJ45_11626 [Morchella importuna]KAH8144402.1 hypothetical protein LAJ45_11626 [Morchella importuna]